MPTPPLSPTTPPLSPINVDSTTATPLGFEANSDEVTAISTTTDVPEQTNMDQLLDKIAKLTPPSTWHSLKLRKNHSKRLRVAWKLLHGYTKATGWFHRNTVDTLGAEKTTIHQHCITAMESSADFWATSGEQNIRDELISTTDIPSTFQALRQLLNACVRAKVHLVLLNLHYKKSDTNGKLYMRIENMRAALSVAILGLSIHERSVFSPEEEMETALSLPTPETASSNEAHLTALFGAIAHFTTTPALRHHWAHSIRNGWKKMLTYPALAEKNRWFISDTLSLQKKHLYQNYITEMESVAVEYHHQQDEANALQCVLDALCQLIDITMNAHIQISRVNRQKQHGKSADNGKLQERILRIHTLLLNSINYLDPKYYQQESINFDLLPLGRAPARHWESTGTAGLYVRDDGHTPALD